MQLINRLSASFKSIAQFFLVFLVLSFSIYAQSAKFNEAAKLYTEGKYKQAGVIFEELIKNGNNTRDVYTGAIDCAVKLNQYTNATELTEKALLKFGNDYELENLLAQLYAQTGKTGKAIALLEKIIKTFPDSTQLKSTLSELHVIRGSQEYTNNRIDNAIRDFKSALKLNFRNDDARQRLILILIKNKRHAEALPFANEGYKLNKTNSLYLQLYLETLLGLENYEEAVVISEQMAKYSPNDLQIQLNTALLYRYNSEPKKAFEKYAGLRTRFPKSKEVFLAEIGLLDLYNQSDTIIARYREYLLNSPDDRDMLTGLGKIYERRKSFDTARTIYRQLITRDIDRDALILIADTYLKEGNTTEARKEYENYIKSGGKNKEAFYSLRELYDKLGETTLLRNLLHKSITTFAEETAFSVILSKQYFYSGFIDSAFIILEPVKDRASEFAEISFFLAQIQMIKGDTSKAVIHFTRSIKFGIRQSQAVQAKILATISGDGVNNPDSAEVVRKNGIELDTLSVMLKNSFKYLSRLQSKEQYAGTLKRLITEMPTAAPLYLQRAKLYEQTGENTKAGEDYELALSLSPSSDEVQSAAGDYYFNNGYFEKSLLSYRKALSVNKRNPQYYRKVIDVAQKINQLNDICNYWLKLYETDKKNSLLREFLIEALHKCNRNKEADVLIGNE